MLSGGVCKGDPGDIIYMCSSKAFGNVPYSGLLKKLNFYGTGGIVCLPMESSLKNT